MPNKKLKVLFLCTGNSCRSQMAEGLTRALKNDIIEAYSAGIETHGLNPNAVQVMEEIGIDISQHKSECVDDLLYIDFDYVVTVCNHAHETCPIFPGKAKVTHTGFDDPPALAKQLASKDEQLECYRRVRDEIKNFIESLPESLGSAISPREHSERSDANGSAISPREHSGRSDATTQPSLTRSEISSHQKASSHTTHYTQNHTHHRKLPHDIPSWVQQGARHFITINCQQRSGEPLLKNDIAKRLLESAMFYEELNKWYIWLIIIMPDHVHLIASFDLEEGIKQIVSAWKRYQKTTLNIEWQSDFFEHRLRNDAEFDEKASYIRMNPVRKELVELPEQWPYIITRNTIEDSTQQGSAISPREHSERSDATMQPSLTRSEISSHQKPLPHTSSSHRTEEINHD